MTTPPFSDQSPVDPRLFDLMVKSAIEGLNESEQRELKQLSAGCPDEPERIELTVAAAELAIDALLPNMQDSQSVPDALRQRLERDAQAFFATESNPVQPDPGDADEGSRLTPASTIGRPVTRREMVAMIVAAACLILVFTGLNPMAWDVTKNNGNSMASTATPQEQLDALLETPPDDLIQLDWVPVSDTDVAGRIVWSDREQTGFMVFQGLDANDPDQQQYQLWIYDTDPQQKYPVNGGVFNISSSDQRSVVPIDSGILVKKAVQFAVTVEQPGGVVVSEKETIPALAKLTP